MSVATSYYVYYDVLPERAELVRKAVEELQRALVAQVGIQGRLLCRRDRPQTWMEVYDGVVDARGFELALNAQLERTGLSSLLGPGVPRHTEIFRPL